MCGTGLLRARVAMGSKGSTGQPSAHSPSSADVDMEHRVRAVNALMET